MGSDVLIPSVADDVLSPCKNMTNGPWRVTTDPPGDYHVIGVLSWIPDYYKSFLPDDRCFGTPLLSKILVEIMIENLTFCQ